MQIYKKLYKMKILIKLMFCCGVAALFAGCCACRRYQKQNRKPLVGTEWQLIQLGGRNVTPQEGKFTVQFGADGTLSGVGSCNRLTGRYEESANRTLKIGPVGMTMMMCPSDMDTEQALGRALEETDHYDMDGPMLLLLSDGELRAVFQAKLAATEQPSRKKKK